MHICIWFKLTATTVSVVSEPRNTSAKKDCL